MRGGGSGPGFPRPRERTVEAILSGAGAVLLAASCLLPLVAMLLVAGAERHDFPSPEVALEPTLRHLREAWSTTSLRVPEALRNSLLVSLAVAVAAPALGLLAAYPLARLDLPGRRTLLMLLLACTLFPPICLAGHLYRMLSALGWLNTLPGLILPYVAWMVPFCAWFLAGHLDGLPRELDRAAAVDGCGPFGILRRVLLPLAVPGLVSAALLAFVFAFNEFLFALLFTVDHRARTLPVAIAQFQGTHGETPWGQLMAVAVLGALPGLVLALLFQGRIVQGLTRGAVKG